MWLVLLPLCIKLWIIVQKRKKFLWFSYLFHFFKRNYKPQVVACLQQLALFLLINKLRTNLQKDNSTLSCKFEFYIYMYTTPYMHRKLGVLLNKNFPKSNSNDPRNDPLNECYATHRINCMLYLLFCRVLDCKNLQELPHTRQYPNAPRM